MSGPKLKKYDWKKSAWKGLRPALTVGAAAVVTSFVGGIDVETLMSFGVPAVAAPFVVEAGRNWAKNREQ